MHQYTQTRRTLLSNLNVVSAVEHYATASLCALLSKYVSQIRRDYDEASSLRPYWVNYPPDDRGRAPRGDQIPWIEVGEHAVGDNLISRIHELGDVRFEGLPAGPDIRFTLRSDEVRELSEGVLDGVWFMVDVKSVGPRDNFEHAVMSHNQVSGSGEWDMVSGSISNRVVTAVGARASHKFHCSLPPLYIMPEGSALLNVTLFIKPIYEMLSGGGFGQHLSEIKVGCIPNGLLLSGESGYLAKHPGLLYPGKDDKSKNPKKLRARVDFSLLRNLDEWRLVSLSL